MADEPILNVVVGGSVSGNIDATGDTDDITVSLVAGETYLVSLRGTGAIPLNDTFLQVFAPGGALVNFDDDGGRDRYSIMTFTATVTGTYTIRAASFSNPGDPGIGEWTVDVRVQGADTVGATNDTSVAIDLGTTFGFRETATVSGGADLDRYKVELQAGHFYTFKLAAGADYNTDYSAVPAGEIDTILRLRNAAGTLLAQNDDIKFSEEPGGDISSSLSFFVETSGTYYLDVTGYAGQTGGYVLDVEDGLIGGADDDTLVGNDADNRIEGRAGNDTLVGRLGADFLDGGADTDTASYTGLAAVSVDLRITTQQNTGGGGLDTLRRIENLIGTANNDSFIGNDVANVLNGQGGADRMEGRGGDDAYFVDNVGDQVIETSSAFGANDRVYTSVSFTLAAGQYVESLAVTNAATTNAINLTGNELSQNLHGNNGANIFNGRGGADRMDGKNGNDAYFVDSANDQVIEAVGAGANDRVYITVSYALAAGQQVEVLAVTNAATTIAINLTGNEFSQNLYGNNGANVFNGGGGADRMDGKAGNDAYFVDHASDVVVEAANGGTNDRVYTSVSYTLRAGSGVEVLQTTDQNGTSAINLTGNAFSQNLYGNNGANIFKGGGGADRMDGRGGNDAYFVDSANDQVIEAVGGGANDRVYTSVSYTLAAGAEIEILLTTNPSATTAINLTGNERSQNLYGNNGANVFNGKGGADLMDGKAGSDAYFIDNAGDRIIEAVGQGTNDRLYSSADFVLAAGSEVEVLQTIDQAGTAGIDLTGNEFGQQLLGNAGVNFLDGGDGADTLRGFAGTDVFVFHRGEADGDRIIDFAGNGAAAGDQLRFVGYGPGAEFQQLNATQWRVVYDGGIEDEVITFSNSAAVDPSDVFFV